MLQNLIYKLFQFLLDYRNYSRNLGIFPCDCWNYSFGDEELSSYLSLSEKQKDRYSNFDN